MTLDNSPPRIPRKAYQGMASTKTVGVCIGDDGQLHPKVDELKFCSQVERTESQLTRPRTTKLVKAKIGVHDPHKGSRIIRSPLEHQQGRNCFLPLDTQGDLNNDENRTHNDRRTLEVCVVNRMEEFMISPPHNYSLEDEEKRHNVQRCLSIRLEEALLPPGIPSISTFGQTGNDQWTPTTPAKSEELKKSTIGGPQLGGSVNLDSSFANCIHQYQDESSVNSFFYQQERTPEIMAVNNFNRTDQSEEPVVRGTMGPFPPIFQEELLPSNQLPLDSLMGNLYPEVWNYDQENRGEDVLSSHLQVPDSDECWGLDMIQFEMDPGMMGLESDDLSLNEPINSEFSDKNNEFREESDTVSNNSGSKYSVLKAIQVEKLSTVQEISPMREYPYPVVELCRQALENLPPVPSLLDLKFAEKEGSEEDDFGVFDDLLEEGYHSSVQVPEISTGSQAIGNKRKRGVQSTLIKVPGTEQAQAARNRRTLMKDALQRVTEFIPSMRQQFGNGPSTIKENPKKMDTDALLKELADHAKKLVREISFMALGNYVTPENSEDEDSTENRLTVSSIPVSDDLEVQRAKSKEEKAAARAKRIGLRKVWKNGTLVKQQRHKPEAKKEKEFEAKWVHKLRPIGNREPSLTLKARGFKVVRSPWKLSRDARDPIMLKALATAEGKFAEMEKKIKFVREQYW